MKKYLDFNQIFALTKTHFFVSLVATLLGAVMIPFGTNGFFKTAFSVVMSILYAVCIYSKAGDIAKNDKIFYKEDLPSYLKGLILPVGIWLVWIFLYVLFDISWKYRIMSFSTGIINNMLFVIWNYVFTGFLNPLNGHIDAFGVVMFFAVSLLASFGGYIATRKNFDISTKVSKLIYEEETEVKELNGEEE